MGASLRLTNSTFSSRISLSNDNDPANSSHRRQQSVKAPCSSKLAPRSGSQRPATPPQGQSGRMPTASLEKVSASAWKPKEAPRQPRFQARLGKPTTGHPTPRPEWQNANSQPKQVPCKQHHIGTLQGTEAGAIGWRNQCRTPCQLDQQHAKDIAASVTACITDCCPFSPPKRSARCRF